MICYALLIIYFYPNCHLANNDINNDNNNNDCAILESIMYQ